MRLTKILVINGENPVNSLLLYSFSQQGWNVIAAKNGPEGLDKIEKESPDLVILDMMLPGIEVFEICRQIRQWSQVPLIVLSDIDETKDKVRCLNLGADDYITKPFKVEELIARIKVALKHNKFDMSPASVIPFIGGNIKIDFLKRRVFVKNNVVTLMPTEYKLLLELVTNVDRVLTFEELLRKIWGQEFIKERDYLYVQISHLREKLETDPKNPRHIINIPRVGYKFQK
jgi:two-component system, OmpR family, KDP operon response regulator KdpE